MKAGESDIHDSTGSSLRRWIGPLLVVGCILLANGAYLVGYSDPDPLGPIGRIAISQRVGALPGQRSIDPNNGFVTEAIGRQAARQIVRGHVPGWNPYEGIGMPLLASPQSAASLPFTGLLLLPNGLFVETVALEIFAGLATYMLIRKLGIGCTAAVFGGVAFGLNGTFAWLQNGAMLPVAFIPFAILGIEFAYEHAHAQRAGGWFTIAIGLALMVHAGFVETTYIAGLLLAAWSTSRLFSLRARQRWFLIKKLLTGLVVALMLSAPLLLPFADYLRVAFIGAHSGAFANTVLPLPALSVEVGLPYAHGPIFAFSDANGVIDLIWGSIGGYLAPSVVLLSAVGLFSKRNRALRITLGLWILICLSKTFGPSGFVTAINLIPGMKSAAFYRYMNPSLELAAVVLATFAIDDLVRRDISKRRFAIAAVTMACLMLQNFHRSATVVRHLAKAAGYLNVSIGWALGVVILITALGLVGIAIGPTHRATTLVRACVMVAIVDIVVMFGIPTLSANRDVKTDTESVIWLRDHLGLQRYLTLGPINVNYGSYFGIGLAENNNVPLPKLWTNWLETHFKTLDPVNFPRGAEFGTVLNHPELLDDLAILYIVLPRRYGLPRSLRNTLRLVHRDKLATIYERPGTRPYFDVKNEPCSVLTISRTTVRTRCDHPTELVRREQFFPGWSAEVNGKDVPIRLAGELFQGISLPTGTSEIHFRYTPSYFPQGVLLFFAGCTWMLSAGVVIHRRCWTSRSQRRSASLLSSKNAPPTFVTEPYELGPGYDRFE